MLSNSRGPEAAGKPDLQPPVAAAYGPLPLSFEPNLGQADPSVDFVAHGQGYSVTLAPAQVLLTLQPDSGPRHERPALPTLVGVHLLRTSATAQASGHQQLPGVANYFIGSDPRQWHTDIPTFGQVAYRSVYPGIDLVYHANQSQLETDFVVNPGADPGVIRLGFTGAQRVLLDANGQLVLEFPGGQLRQTPPLIYQDTPAGGQVVAGRFVANDVGEIGFEVSAYDSTRPLIIDPVLVYSSLVGGSGLDSSTSIAVDAGANAYITGQASSVGLPTTPGAFQRTFGGGATNAFVCKFNRSGSALVYCTYLGGSGSGADLGSGIAVDSAGDAYVTGQTETRDFPTTPGAFERTSFGGPHAFVTRLNSTGSALIYSTLLGGTDNGSDFGSAIAVGAGGAAYVTGQTSASDFPTTPGAFKRTLGGGQHAFVTRLNGSGSSLDYSTYVGGNGFDLGSGIAVDAGGNAYITGQTTSSNFPITPGAFNPTSGFVANAFVSKLNPAGSALVYSTFLGKGDGHGSAVDAAGNAYVTGHTDSATFPTTPGAFRRTFGGDRFGRGDDAFVTRLNSTGSGLLYSTYLGGSAFDVGNGIAVDGSGNAYVVGQTGSADFPTTAGALQRTFGGFFDAFVAKLNPNGSALIYSTYFGGTASDSANGIAVDADENAYVTGETFSGEFTSFVEKLALGDKTAPICALTAVIAGPPRQLQIRVQDPESGLLSVRAITLINATAVVPAFAAGTNNPVVVTASKVDQAQGAAVTLEVSDVLGNAITCDPEVITVTGARGRPVSKVVSDAGRTENSVSIYNDTPGLERLDVTVNDRMFKVAHLEDGEIQTIDVSAALHAGNNTIVLTPRGASGSAEVVISDIGGQTAIRHRIEDRQPSPEAPAG
jgi:hypothetical protein